MSVGAEYTVGVISDTHGLLRRSVVDRLKGVDLILHAGDVCSREIPRQLSTLAPFYAVRGNNDPWDCGWPPREMVRLGEDYIYIVHMLEDMDIAPAVCGVKAVIYGHTHRFSLQHKNGVMYANPGSVGPRRYNYPISFGLLTKRSGKWGFEPVFLES